MRNRLSGIVLSVAMIVTGVVGCDLAYQGRPGQGSAIASTQPTTQPTTQPAAVAKAGGGFDQNKFDHMAEQVEAIAKTTAVISGGVAVVPSPAMPWASIVASIAGGIALVAHALNSKNSGSQSKNPPPG